jgi:hypothetical protein
VFAFITVLIFVVDVVLLSRLERFGVDEFEDGHEDVIIPCKKGSSLQGIVQPRQNRDHGHKAQILPFSATVLSVNGKSYPKLSSQSVA